jgi:hypothetical protein
MDELVSFYSSSGVFDMKDHNNIRESLLPPQSVDVDPSHPSFDVNMNQVLSFSDDSGSYPTSHNSTPETFFPKDLLAPQQQANDPSNGFSVQSIDLYASYPHYSSNDVSNHLSLFETTQMGVNWESTVPAFEAGHVGPKNSSSVSQYVPQFRRPVTLTPLPSFSMYFGDTLYTKTPLREHHLSLSILCTVNYVVLQQCS